MAALVGRWMADSTFTVEDTRATGLQGRGVLLELFPDTTYAQLDTTRIAFPGKSEGTFSLLGDTLIFLPTAGIPDTLLVKLRFLGNYLELDRPADQRFSFFHKVKPQDSLTRRAILKDSLWLEQGRRSAQGIFQREELNRNFSYLRFSGDTMWTDTRLNGIIRLDSGKLEQSESNWTWRATGGTRRFLAELIANDSLRLWPLREGRTDSGFRLYTKTFARHGFDVDMRPLFGHLRGDSIRFPDSVIETHFGRFYDWIFTEDHKLRLETNMRELPEFKSWTLDSGYLSLEAPGVPITRFRVDLSGSKAKLAADSGKAFGKRVTLYQTRFEADEFLGKPLDRFQEESYFQLIVSGDTSYRFFSANHNDGRFEISGQADTAAVSAPPFPSPPFAYWTAIALDKSQETFQSGQAGFFFAFQGRKSGLGRYSCKSVPDQGLVIRLTGTLDGPMAQGLIQGSCRILSADSAIADSSLDVEGAFRLKRKTVTGLASPLWSQK